MRDLSEVIFNNRDPVLEQDYQSWLIWWLVENRPQGMTQWWYVVDESVPKGIHHHSPLEKALVTQTLDVSELEKTASMPGGIDLDDGHWDIIGRNYKTLGGTSGYGNYFVISGASDSNWEEGRWFGQAERTEIMRRMINGFKDETVGTEVDYQFFMENNGWYLAERPDYDNSVGLFYRGSNDTTHGVVVGVTDDLMPVTLTTVGKMTHNDIETDTIRFLDDRDSWILGPKVLEVLNWSRFPTVFLE
jgi:hypothetical protein